jgi:hypothetical protein
VSSLHQLALALSQPPAAATAAAGDGAVAAAAAVAQLQPPHGGSDDGFGSFVLDVMEALGYSIEVCISDTGGGESIGSRFYGCMWWEGGGLIMALAVCPSMLWRPWVAALRCIINTEGGLHK